MHFRDIEVIKSRLFDLRKEKEGSIHVRDYAAVLEQMRDFNHYLLDFVMPASRGEVEDEVFLDLASLIRAIESLRLRLIGKSETWGKGDCKCSSPSIGYPISYSLLFLHVPRVKP